MDTDIRIIDLESFQEIKCYQTNHMLNLFPYLTLAVPKTIYKQAESEPQHWLVDIARTEVGLIQKSLQKSSNPNDRAEQITLLESVFQDPVRSFAHYFIVLSRAAQTITGDQAMFFYALSLNTNIPLPNNKMIRSNDLYHYWFVFSKQKLQENLSIATEKLQKYKTYKCQFN